MIGAPAAGWCWRWHARSRPSCAARARPPAAPGLAPLGDGDGQIGLPVNPQIVDSVVVHRGEVYAAVRQLSRIDPGANGEKFQLRVQRFTQAKDAWQPVGGPLSNSGGRRDDMSLLSARGELYVAWTEFSLRAQSTVAVVGQLMPGGSWQLRAFRIQQPGPVRPAQVGDELWVGWQAAAGVGLARIRPGRIDQIRTDALPPDVHLVDLVGYGDAAYVAYGDHVGVPRHRDQHGDEVPETWVARLRVARLVPVPDSASVQVTSAGEWQGDLSDVHLTAGTPDAPARPVLAWNRPFHVTRPDVVVMQLRDDGAGFDRIPVAPLITLRRISRLRGLVVTPTGISIAAVGERDGNVRVYTLAGDPAHLTITAGDELPQENQAEDVAMVPAPAPADPGTLVLGYNRRSPTRAAAMRYSP